MSNVKAVLFDMDGTLLAPEEHSSLLEFKARWGIPMEQLIVPNLSKLPPDAYAAFVELEDSLAEHAVLRPGVKAFLIELHTRGVKTALCTNNTIKSAHTMIEKFDLHLDLILTRDDYTMKPDPAMLLAATTQLEVSTLEAVMVGDTRADVGAALASGVRHCYLIAEPWNAELEGETVTRVADFAALSAAILTPEPVSSV